MNKCEHFKDLILTDYIDGELDKEAIELLEGHLLDCGDCRIFFKEVKNNVTLPFEGVSKLPVPAELWRTIKEGIEYKNQAVSPLAHFMEGLKGLLVFPRMVPVFASLVLMFIVGSVTLNNIQIQQVKDKEQGEYLVSTLSSTLTAAPVESADLGTPIEHYFL